ncbi:MAG: branched-chain amino acid aminotransferase [Rhodobacteraceae bacterium]|nr:branched-chain amino acid aminotransferase [Paracoccaceae bacterium]MCY4196645.1 branched-chain amino acid aminotransferase [Paracoccaceae bacterium]MCY4326300.1 branched-chain amino acid aminotransferase [Paracoccaceae bacterium]
MATGKNIRTYFQGKWHDEDVLIMRAADHGSWLGSTVFDGARYAHGLTPDLLAHCQRLNDSAMAMSITPIHRAEEIAEIAREGLQRYPKDAAVYIRPMYWALHGGPLAVLPKPGATAFCICLEELPLADPEKSVRLTRTRFERPVIASSIVNAKTGCLYPNNARMLAEANEKGFDNALVADALGNVAEAATANVFMTRDGEVLTPAANGTFLAGVTRKRIIQLLREAGYRVSETILTFEDFHRAEEVFLTGNLSKVTTVSQFENTHYQPGPIAKAARRLYWEWAVTESTT